MTATFARPPLAAVTPTAAVGALRARGLRVSAARRLVLEALYASEGPVSAEDIAGGLHGSCRRRTSPRSTATSTRSRPSASCSHVHLGHGPGLYALAGRHRGWAVCEALRRLRDARCRRGRRDPRGGRARDRLRRALLPLPHRRRLRRLSTRRHPCTSLTASCRPRSPPRAPSRPPAPSRTGCAARAASSTSAASRCSASPPRSCSPRRCSTSRSPAARAATSSAPRWRRSCSGPGSPAW